MTSDRVVEELRAIGMSAYEAKAYVALLAAGQPINGYEVAKRSGVPRSTVYETLGKLVNRGAAFEVRAGEDGSATDYLPLPAESLVARLRRDFDSRIDSLSASLPKIASPMPTSVVQYIHGRVNVIERAQDLIASANEDLFVSVWQQESDQLTEPLRQAARRGVEVFVVGFGDIGEPVGHTYHHQFSDPEVVFDRVGARLFVVSSDRESVLIGGAVGDTTWGMWSDDPAVVLVAVEYVRHDIAMQVLVDHMGTDSVHEFWHTDEALERLQTGTGAPGLRRQGDPGAGTPRSLHRRARA